MKIFLISASLALFALPALAEALPAPAYETLEQQQERQNAQNYDRYRRNNYQAPADGYADAPVTADHPGMVTPDWNKILRDQRRDE